MSPLSWRQAYKGMVRGVASWRVEVGWRGFKEWRGLMERLQYDALRKCNRGERGARMETIGENAAVEDVDIIAEAA